MEKFFSTLTEVKFADDAALGTFSGYGAVFGNLDMKGDMIAKGAFTETLKQWRRRKKYPPMLLQHGGFMAEDEVPIGKWLEMKEDDTGLAVEGRLINMDTERGRAVYGAMKEGVLEGLSIGFFTKEFTLGTKPDEPRRTLKKIELVEVSIVTFPANTEARVESVKSTPRTIREFEAMLRDVAGFSNAAAKAIAAGGFKAMPEPRDEDGEGLAAALSRNIAILKAK
jgi:HK97 family phage prohead protease